MSTTTFKFIYRSSQSIDVLYEYDFPSSLEDLMCNLSIICGNGLSSPNMIVVCEHLENGLLHKDTINDEEKYGKKMRRFTSAQIPSCLLYLRIQLTLAYSCSTNYFPVTFDTTPVSFFTKTGLDAKFHLLLEQRVAECAETIKANVSDFECVLFDKRKVFYELSEENINSHEVFTIMMRKSVPYSHIKLSEITSLFQWNGSEDIVTTISDGSEITSTRLINAICGESSLIPHMEEKADMVLKFLTYFTKLMNPETCYSEASRRMIIDIFLVPALYADEGEAPLSLSVEYKMDLANFYRFGNGPLDYFVESESLNTDVVTVTAFVRDDDDLGSESAFTDETQHDGEAEANHNCESRFSILEAKMDIGRKSLEKALGQLFSQMLDGLKLAKSRKRKRSSADNPNVESWMVKGILSTGQQNMFFSMLKSSNQAQALPVLSYYGKWTVHVLPQQANRDSGLVGTDIVKLSEIETLLKVFYHFVRF